MVVSTTDSLHPLTKQVSTVRTSARAPPLADFIPPAARFVSVCSAHSMSSIMLFRSARSNQLSGRSGRQAIGFIADEVSFVEREQVSHSLFSRADEWRHELPCIASPRDGRRVRECRYRRIPASIMVRVNVFGGEVAWKRRQIRQAFGKLVQPTIRVVHAVLPVSRSKVPLEVIRDRKPRGGRTLREGFSRLGIKLNRRWCHRHSRIAKGLLMPLILSRKTTPVQL